MTIIKLPVDSDLSECSFQWAARLLNETPTRLRVSPMDADAGIRFGDIDIRVDPSLSCCGWVLEGTERAVSSEGG